MDDATRTFSFEPLRKGELGVSARYGSFLAEAASYCLEFKKHPNPVRLELSGDVQTSGWLHWNDLEDDFDSTYADLEEATEYGAYGVGVTVAVKLIGISYVERSAKGTGIDYWLCERDPSGPFQRAARLEISGILDGDEATISRRLKRKLAQTDQSNETLLPAYAVVVEFGLPNVRLAKRKTEKDDSQ